MPENVPLYNDMRVTEYLDYRAALKGVPHRRIAERVGDVKELCGLNDVEKKLIGALSKGYRQRVGLADALVHEPDLLILDEPTSGLDPNQIRQVRDLIKNLGQPAHHSAFHSHPARGGDDLQPRHHHQQRKDRSLRHAGKLARARCGRRAGSSLEAKTGTDDGAEELKKIAGVKDVSLTSEGDWQIFSLRVEAGADVRPEVFRLASERQLDGARAIPARRRWKMSSSKSLMPMSVA